jgi:hypothetical protein
MNSMSSVVDQLSNELAERRRTAGGRRAAYLALARAILVEEQAGPLQMSPKPDQAAAWWARSETAA